MTALNARALRHAMVGPAVTLVLSFLAAAQALRLWKWRPGIPMSLDGDAPSLLFQVRGLLEQGWSGTNPHVGAPFGSNLSWFTTGDVINFAGVKALGLFSDSPATVAGVFFILQFPFAALSAYWLARQLRVSRPMSVCVGVLFSVLPGHQLWFGHLWLSAYWMVPLALWLVIRVARGDRLFPTRSQLRACGSAGRRSRLVALGTAGILLAVGLSDVYYVAFTLLLLVTGLMLRLGTVSRPRRLLQGVVVTAVIATLCGASLFVATRGRVGDTVTGALPAQRGIGESELYSGKLIDLVLPWYEHRAAPLHFLTWAYGVAAAPPSVERPALGALGLVGVAGLLWYVVSHLSSGRRVGGPMGLLACLLLVCLGFYTRGGLGSLVALFVTPQIRTWSRFVVFIGLIGLLAAGLWLTSRQRLKRRRVTWAVAAGLLVIGVLDQTNPRVAPAYGTLSAEGAELTTFGQDLQQAVGNCPVFQLPVVAFPEEPPPEAMGDYDHLLPSIMSPSGLSWSYGAIRGTSRADWQLALPIDRPRTLLNDLRTAGFCAVEVDHDGYTSASDPGSALEEALGAPVARAQRSRLTAYDLRRLAPTADPQRADGVLRPMVASVGGSLVEMEGDVPFQWTGPDSTITVANLGTTPRAATLSFDLTGNGGVDRSVTIRTPGRATTTLTLPRDTSQAVSVNLDVPAGTVEVELAASGDARPVSGSNGSLFAAVRIKDLRLSTRGPANAASLQQFFAASPRSSR